MIKNYLSRLFFFLVCFGLSGSFAIGDAFKYPTYDIKATIDVAQKKITASQAVTFVNNSPEALSELYFHIYPNRHYSAKEKEFLTRYASYFHADAFPEGFQTSSFQIQSVEQDRNLLKFFIEGEDQTVLKVSLMEPLKPGEKARIAIDFSLTLPHSYGRLGQHAGVMALSHWYPILAIYDGQGWHNDPFYPFHRPFFSEASGYHVELIIPDEETVVYSGILQKEENLTDQKKRLTIDSELPIREFSLALSADYKLIEGTWEDVTIKSFYLPGEEGSAQKAFAVARDLMQFYTKKFGPYPYKVFNIAPVYLGYGGEQMSNLVYIDTRVYDLPGFLERYFDFLIAHETGHQWFYNLVGMDEYTEMWLEEGVNSYFISEYLEEKYGSPSCVSETRGPPTFGSKGTRGGSKAEILSFPQWAKDTQWLFPEWTFDRTRDVRYKMLARIGLDNPVASNLASFKEPSSIFSLTYGKGSRIVEMLKNVVGEDKFNKIFTRVFEEYRFKNLSIKEFIKICEEESGQYLGWFFESWLYTKDYFDVAVTSVKNNKIGLESKGKIVMPVEVEIKFADGSTDTVIWDGRSGEEEISVEKNIPVKKVVLDPARKLLDLDRTNNQWPRQILIKPVPIYWGLYDIPVFLPDDSYNLVFGPEAANGGLGVKASLQKPYDQNFYTGTDYEFSEHIHHSRVGYELSNILQTQTALGFEVSNQTDHDDGDEDLVSGKLFLRRELLPIAKGIFDINDHASFYLIRNQGLNKTLISGGGEDSRDISYLKRSEAIVGSNLHVDSSFPYPDPSSGYKLDTMLEHSGHFLGATQYFNRGAVDTAVFYSLSNSTCPFLDGTWAARFKYGLGYPNDKNLFELGGINGLRGFDRKEIRGAKGLMGSLEYRFPLKESMNLKFLDNIFGVESIGAVAFLDAGQSWYKDFDESDLKKDAGVGLRLTVNVGAMIEKVIFRTDLAWPINEEESDGHFWFGVNQAF